ncbi:hypothetical protein Bbelb_177010 [Branchiostoma belcheri]|nr:hypothetical protein Bbelb_177010 [Branchiostoma belcheri]
MCSVVEENPVKSRISLQPVPPERLPWLGALYTTIGGAQKSIKFTTTKAGGLRQYLTPHKWCSAGGEFEQRGPPGRQRTQGKFAAASRQQYSCQMEEIGEHNTSTDS